MRDMSTLMRAIHPVTRVNPYRSANCADLGDTSVNPIDLHDSINRIEAFYQQLHEAGVMPLSAGGDHLITLPIMRVIAKDSPVGMVHIDAHSDTNDRYFGDHTLTHGTPFRRAIEEGMLDPRRTIQIGIRGGLYSKDDNMWAIEQGIRLITYEEYMDMGVDAVIAEIPQVIGDGPTYISFDVDGLDPVYAPGTGTPEIGGLTPFEAQKIIRSLRGRNLVGADVVEVAPPFDASGMTALVGVTIMWEMLCLLAEPFGRNG
jgi:guanidinopropionase